MIKAFYISLFIAFSLGVFAQNKIAIVKTDSVVKTISVNTKIDSVKTEANKIYINVQGEEKNWWSDWLPFFATIIVAYAAYRGVIKQSKASSVSGFRVTWIEDLRVCYSKFLVHLRNVDTKIRLKKIEPKNYTKDEDWEQVNFLKTKMKLMLNHSEDEHIAFWEALTQYMTDHNNFYRSQNSLISEQDLDQKRVQIEDLLLTIFKKEWDKAKNFG
jgi:hypothetical protein